jgi:hypothetical protein
MLADYFGALVDLIEEGTLAAIGISGGWPGTPEALFNADWTLNAQGLALKAFYGQFLTTPTLNLVVLRVRLFLDPAYQ